MIKGYQGMWFKKGLCCCIVDMSTLWANLDADLAWIRYGQKVVIRRGDARKHLRELSPTSLQNWTTAPELSRPELTFPISLYTQAGMFVSATLESKINSKGSVMSKISRKWISSIHPEIIKDKPGRR